MRNINNIFHKINMKLNVLWLVENTEWHLETNIHSPPKTKEWLCPVLEKGRWIAKHSLKTLSQATKQRKEKMFILEPCPLYLIYGMWKVWHLIQLCTEHVMYNNEEVFLEFSDCSDAPCLLAVAWKSFKYYTIPVWSLILSMFSCMHWENNGMLHK